MLRIRFVAQGDKEKILGLPLTPGYDRKTADVAVSQLAFYKYIVQPLYTAMDELVRFCFIYIYSLFCASLISYNSHHNSRAQILALLRLVLRGCLAARLLQIHRPAARHSHGRTCKLLFIFPLFFCISPFFVDAFFVNPAYLTTHTTHVLLSRSLPFLNTSSSRSTQPWMNW